MLRDYVFLVSFRSNTQDYVLQKNAKYGEIIPMGKYLKFLSLNPYNV